MHISLDKRCYGIYGSLVYPKDHPIWQQDVKNVYTKAHRAHKAEQSKCQLSYCDANILIMHFHLGFSMITNIWCHLLAFWFTILGGLFQNIKRAEYP